MGKVWTAIIERDNSNTHHHESPNKDCLERIEIVDNAIKLRRALTVPEVFAQYQQMAYLSLHKYSRD